MNHSVITCPTSQFDSNLYTIVFDIITFFFSNRKCELDYYSPRYLNLFKQTLLKFTELDMASIPSEAKNLIENLVRLKYFLFVFEYDYNVFLFFFNEYNVFFI